MSFDPETIYALLPAYLRLRDAARGEPLKDLISVIGSQVQALEEDQEQSYDNLFIETCAPWVVPYIGDLVQTTPLFDLSRARDSGTLARLAADLQGPQLRPELGLRARADVARTIYYRRRKTTLPMLEQLASDVTGWAAHVREFFQTLAWSQAVRNHIRAASFYAPDLRRPPDIDRIDGPFDTTPRLVDVRPPSQVDGWRNIPNVGIFLWRLKSVPLDQVPARPVAAGDFRYHVSPLGQQAPLFARWRADIDATAPSSESLLPGPIRPAAFYEDLVAYGASKPLGPGQTLYYGRFGDAPAGTPPLPDAPGASLLVLIDGQPVPPEQIQCMNLAQWRQPLGKTVGVDVARGRVSLGPGWPAPHKVLVSCFHGFPADLGGGGYQRQSWLLSRKGPSAPRVIEVSQAGAAPGALPTIKDALDAWAAAGKGDAIISILDNGTYEETLSIEPSDGRSLAIEAADRKRPHLRLKGPLTLTGAHDTATVTLSGLLVEGAVHIDGSLGRLRLIHTTLVPGLSIDADSKPTTTDPSLVAAAGTAAAPLNTTLDVELLFSITGPLHLPATASRLWVLDSIVDGLGGAAIASETGAPGFGPPAWIERATVIGPSYFRQIVVATEVVFSGRVSVERRQQGCVRFSYVPGGSSTPRRYHCQPEFEAKTEIEAAEAVKGKLSDAEKQAIADAVAAWLAPRFTDLRYGQPAYAQLHLNCPRQIREGAADGSEMGAYCHLKQPQRFANLRLRLREYLPFGREPAVIVVT
jgi:hypothetical protein